MFDLIKEIQKYFKSYKWLELKFAVKTIPGKIMGVFKKIEENTGAPIVMQITILVCGVYFFSWALSCNICPGDQIDVRDNEKVTIENTKPIVTETHTYSRGNDCYLDVGTLTVTDKIGDDYIVIYSSKQHVSDIYCPNGVVALMTERDFEKALAIHKAQLKIKKAVQKQGY